MFQILTYNKKIDRFLLDSIKKLENNKVKLILSTQDYLKLGRKTNCNGYFEEDKKELAVATGNGLNYWLPILVHETSHFDQWREKSTVWANYSKAVGKEIILKTRDLELDCEIRSVEKIKKYDLPINKSEYIKKANAYILFYTFIGNTKRWYVIGKEPYNNKKIVNLMPDHFNIDYNVLDKKLEKLYHQCL